MTESQLKQVTDKSDAASKLLDGVTRRLKVTAFIRTTFYAFVISSVLFVGVFASSRLLGLFPFEFDPLMILSVPLLAFFLALVFHRRPSLELAARTVDARAETKDLYLTLSLLDSSAGEYQPLVKQAAEEKAKLVQPKKIVPFSWDRRGWFSLSTVGALVVLVLFVPQLDPFGRIQEAQAVEQKREELDELAKVTLNRKKRLEKKQSSNDVDGKSVSEDVQRAIDDLVGTLQEMKDLERKKNEEALTKQQKKIGEKWNQVRNGADLKELLKQNTGQAFGRNMQQLRELADQLRKGNPEQLQKKIEELKEKLMKLKKIAKEDKDDVETLKKKEALKRQVKKEIEQLQEFAKRHGKNSKLREAVERAMEQLAAGDADEKLTDKAIQDALESLELSKLELEELAKSARDLERLQKALETIQQAKQLNQKGKGEQLDAEWGDKPTLEQMREQYAEMLAKLGLEGQGGGGEGDGNGKPKNGGGQGGEDGKGAGFGGPGQGEGGVAPENKDAKTKFVSKKAKAHVQAGKMLFTMKSKGVSEAGDVNVEFRKLIKEISEGASEAIEQEEIPPGYVPGIKKYFDRIEAAAAANAEQADGQ
jgi:hypothetical protein